MHKFDNTSYSIAMEEVLFNHIDLFTGIAGMTLALKGASAPVMYCDSCKHAQAILNKHMKTGALPLAPITDDVRTCKTDEFKHIDCITAGFPCTGFSTSGRMQAFNNESSGLFFELIKIVQSVQPKLVFMENTPWIAHADNIAQVNSAFVSIGYFLKYCILPAYAVGLPQNRFRWFAIAYRCEPKFLLDFQACLTIDSACPLQPPRTIETEDRQAFRRYGLLRNALVPACARYALHYLLSPSTATHPKFPKPNLNLLLKDGELTLKKPLWPTLHGHYARKGSKLTLRTSFDIGTCMGYEVNTEHGHINMCFLEWLMGFPQNWTLLSAEGPTTEGLPRGH